MSHVAVFGAGAWGVALAHHLSEGAEPGPARTTLWGRSRAQLEQLRQQRRCPKLPGVTLPGGLEIADELEQAALADCWVFAVPCHALREVGAALAQWMRPEVTVVIAAKGVEHPSLRLPLDIVAEASGALAGARGVVLSGPSFAKEVARAQPTSVVAASPDLSLAQWVQQVFSRRRLRVYTSEDPVGVQVAGALKNVIAIAVGASDGLGLGPNARAALITRGLSEIGRLAAALGGRAATVSGLAGLGDLVLTCTGEQSRNRTVGFRLGQGIDLATAVAGLGEVAEGVSTARSAVGLSRRLGVDLPIAQAVDAVLCGSSSPQQAMEALMRRSLKPE